MHEDLLVLITIHCNSVSQTDKSFSSADTEEANRIISSAYSNILKQIIMLNITTQTAHLYFVNNTVYENDKEIRGENQTLSNSTP